MPFPETPLVVACGSASIRAMVRLLILVSLSFCLSGCIAVLGYEPTPAELEAIKRGEDPRAGEAEREAEREKARADQKGNAGESGEPTSRTNSTTYGVDPTEAGPKQGTVLRWLDSATLVIEADSRRETVALPGVQASEDMAAEQTALNDRMDRWTYGKSVTLRYPLQNKQGDVIYRDSEGRLLANIE